MYIVQYEVCLVLCVGRDSLEMLYPSLPLCSLNYNSVHYNLLEIFYPSLLSQFSSYPDTNRLQNIINIALLPDKINCVDTKHFNTSHYMVNCYT